MAAPYQGCRVSPAFKSLWRFGGRVSTTPGGRAYVGSARQQVQVWIRRGKYVRKYHPHGIQTGEGRGSDFGQPGGRYGHGFWYPDWTPDIAGAWPGGGWMQVPQIKQVRLEQSFDNNGITNATIDMDNILYQEVNNGLGVFHLIQRGWFSPLRGYAAPGRPPADVAENQWFLEMPNAEVLVIEGYGSEIFAVYKGLIDDIDLNAKPSTISLTSRDFGGVLVDEHFFGWAKERRVREVIFAPRDEVLNLKKVGGAASASSERGGYQARIINRVDSHAHWESIDRGQSNGVMEWCEIRLPQGKYTDIYINNTFAGQDLYVGFYAQPVAVGNNTYHAHWYPDSGGDVVLDESRLVTDGYRNGKPKGWTMWGKGDALDADPTQQGKWPYFLKIPRAGGGGTRLQLGGTLYTGDDTIFRVGVTNLQPRMPAAVEIRSGQAPAQPGKAAYRAGITRLAAYHKAPPRNPDQNLHDLIPIGDISDIARIIFRWAGFKEWEVEDSGVQLKDRIVCESAKTFMDILGNIRDQLGFVFFMAEPSGTESLGVPVFRNSRLFEPTQVEMERLTDKELLTDAKVKWTNKDERYIIRVRGDLLPKKKGGQPLGTDISKRAMYVYRPPNHDRMAGVIKHATHYEPKLKTISECQIMCYILAAQIALMMVTAILEIPGTPHIGLDSFAAVSDDQTGLNSRIYVTNRISTITTGEDAEWITQLGGSIPDTPDMAKIVSDYANALLGIDRNDRPAVLVGTGGP